MIDSILKAKELLTKEAKTGDRFTQYVQYEDNFVDVAKLFARCAKERIKLPKFVTIDPQEVPASGAEVGACVTSLVNEMQWQFSGFLKCYNQVPLPWPPGNPISDGNQPNPTPDRHSPLL